MTKASLARPGPWVEHPGIAELFSRIRPLLDDETLARRPSGGMRQNSERRTVSFKLDEKSVRYRLLPFSEALASLAGCSAGSLEQAARSMNGTGGAQF